MSPTVLWAGAGALGSTPAVYQIAGRRLLADAPLSALSSFVLADAGDVSLWPPMPQEVEGPLRHIFSGPGWVGNACRQVESRVGPAGYCLDIQGVGALTVSRDGQALASAAPAPGCQPELLAEALLGPALVLALALDATYCMHASAVALDGRALAFLGDSGSGKSTLAAYLGSCGDAGWGWVADDILPVTGTASGLDALPHFPQLKVPPERQPGVMCPEQMPMAAIFLLEGLSPEPESIQAERLGPREALLALVRHTVGARLFDEALLERHLAFCATWAERLPIWRLRYPHRHALLPQVAETIAGTLAVLPQDELSRCLA